MLTYLDQFGTWRGGILWATSDEAFCPGSDSGGIMLLLAPTVSVVTTEVGGFITSSAKDANGERNCAHYHADGELFSVGDGNMTITPVDPFSSHAPASKLTLYQRQGTSKVAVSTVGILIRGFGPAQLVVPDHETSKYKYRNIISEFTLYSGSVYTHTYSYQTWSKPNGTRWNTVTSSTFYEFDSANNRYRTGRPGYWSNWTTIPLLWTAASSSTCSKGIKTPDDVYKQIISLNSILSLDETQIGQLAVDCAAAARSVDMNSLEYLRDIGNFLHDLKSIRATLGKKTSLKKLSDLYLAWRYGVRLTVEDTLDLLQIMQQFTLKEPRDYSWVRAGGSQSKSVNGISAHHDLHLKCRYRRHSNEFSSLVADIQSIGLLPTPKSIWELIPYSFVVDWFTDMSGRMETFDAQVTWEHHEVIGSLLSVKTKYTGMTPSYLGCHGYVGDVSIVHYTREASSFIPTPQYFSDNPIGFHPIESAALIISRKRK